MQLFIERGGLVRCVYGEAIDLHALGQPAISRASHVEPDHFGGWTVNLWPLAGPVLGPFAQRSEALAAEAAWLGDHWPRSYP
jgi:hypothetical protein